MLRNSGALNYPEALGPVQACCGMTFTLPYNSRKLHKLEEE
jgi:hypothetical protein